MKPSRRRKSLRKEVVKITAEGEKTRVHFTLTKKGITEVEVQKFEENTNLIKFGSIKVGGTTLKMYAFRDNQEFVIVRIDENFICLDKFKYRELLSMVMKGGKFIGLLR